MNRSTYDIYDTTTYSTHHVTHQTTPRHATPRHATPIHTAAQGVLPLTHDITTYRHNDITTSDITTTYGIRRTWHDSNAHPHSPSSIHVFMEMSHHPCMSEGRGRASNIRNHPNSHLTNVSQSCHIIHNTNTYSCRVDR